MAKWLVKTESNTYSIDDLKADSSTSWDGVRNYQARNYLCSMKKGDEVLIYHSVEQPIGIIGIGVVSKEAYPDKLQFDKSSKYFDEGASPSKPRWFSPDIKFKQKFKEILSLEELKKDKKLNGMVLLQKGSRLSVQPVSDNHFNYIISLIK